jgi:DNA-binding transcriptional MerR regulator
MTIPLLAIEPDWHSLQLQAHLRSMVKDMDIGEVARRSGLPASTLRFYEERGLITSVGRRGLRRVFAPGVLERLALIGLGRVAGFSLDEIGAMFAPDGAPRINRAILSDKAEALDATIRSLSVLRDGLRHAVACPARTHMECPKFRRLLRLSASGAFERLGPGRASGSARRTPSSGQRRRRPKVRA